MDYEMEMHENNYNTSNIGYDFVKLRDQVRMMKCSIHKRKAFISWDYHYEGSRVITNIYVLKYCCEPFSKEVAKLLEEAQVFDHVHIKDLN